MATEDGETQQAYENHIWEVLVGESKEVFWQDDETDCRMVDLNPKIAALETDKEEARKLFSRDGNAKISILRFTQL